MPTLEEIMTAVESGDYIGFCTECGGQHFGVGPDAHEYKCHFCSAMKVYGAEELLIMGVGI